MARPAVIEHHPKRDRIVRAIVRGDTFRDIAQRFRITKDAVQRYVQAHLAGEMRQARRERDLHDGEVVFAELDDAMDRVRKTLDAINDELEDPQQPGELHVGPRAREVEVTYVVGKTRDGREVTETATLQELLDEASGRASAPYRIHDNVTDPRLRLLQALNAGNKHAELLSRIHGKIRTLGVDLFESNEFLEVGRMLLEVTREYPEAHVELREFFEEHGVSVERAEGPLDDGTQAQNAGVAGGESTQLTKE
jgi:hypothetical protein